MKAQYIRAMDAIHQACLFVAGSCLVVITIIVPYGVFTRYVLNSAASWPEPMAVLLMIVLSFLSAVVCYREYLHIGVGVIPGLLPETIKPLLGWSRPPGIKASLNFRSSPPAWPICRSRSAAR
jgi:TRAP-type C4-dicarboxylate transport system permease small subunit